MRRLNGANALRINARFTIISAQTPATSVAASRSVMGLLTVAGVSANVTPAVISTIALTANTFQNSDNLGHARTRPSSRPRRAGRALGLHVGG